VQYLPDLLLGNQFDHVYHEHRFYFSLDSLATTIERHGLQAIRVERTAQQGGSIRAHIRFIQSPPNPAIQFTRLWADEDQLQLQDLATYQSLQGRAEYLRLRLLDLLEETLQPGVTIAGYGATAKSTTLLNWCGIGQPTLPWIEDTTPAKIGRYSPGMRIPIVGPGECERPAIYFALAWNYIGDILRRERDFVEAGGRFLIPIPVPTLL
jgi:novobiocin biosynthesis protein NovU/D-mycarose 3-C-methyltransferase